VCVCVRMYVCMCVCMHVVRPRTDGRTAVAL